MHAITFRPLARADFPLMRAWLETPHVARRWNHQTTPQALEADFGPGIDGLDKVGLFVAAHAGSPFGFVQRYTFGDNPAYMAELAPILAAPPEAVSSITLSAPPRCCARATARRCCAPRSRNCGAPAHARPR